MLGENISGGNLCDALCSQFADYSALTVIIPPGRDKDERCEEMSYGDDSLVGDRVNNSSDANALFDDTIHIAVDREGGKVVASYLFQNPRDKQYNFLQPFQNTIDYKLTYFFCSARIPRTHVDEFYHNGFPSTGSDASRMTFFYHSAYTMYQKIDEMVMDPYWQNGFVDFQLVKNIEFWYGGIMSVLKYLLWRKSFASHMV